MTRLTRCTASIVALLLLGGTVQATPVIIPPGLNPGDTYQLVFVTSGTRNALSSNIADYDAFVNAQADLGGIGPTSFGPSGSSTISWKSIVMADALVVVEANTHAVVSAPVYNLQGELIATGFSDIWAGVLMTCIR